MRQEGKESKFLAIDTAGSRLTVALHTGRHFVCNDPHAASEALMPSVDRLLAEEGLRLCDLDYIACVTGPGSFTGIRIGVSSVRALCYALAIPALPLHALCVLAYNERADGECTLCVSDASNGLAYMQSFDETRTPRTPCVALPLAEAVEAAKAFEGVVCADAKLCTQIEGAIPPDQDAASLVRAAKAGGGAAGDYNALLPEYVRLSQAEQAYEERLHKTEWIRATATDIPRIAAMEKAYIECPWSENDVRQAVESENSVVYLLRVGGEVVGYGGVRTVFETAEVYNIAVEAQHRRKGYGAAILQKLAEHAKASGANELLLEVSEHNAAALSLYQKHGFTLLSERKNYYKSGSALVMRRVL